MSMEEDSQDDVMAESSVPDSIEPMGQVSATEIDASIVLQEESTDDLAMLATIASCKKKEEVHTPSNGPSPNMGFFNHNPNKFITTMAPSPRVFSSTRLTSLFFDVPIIAWGEIATMTNSSPSTSGRASATSPYTTHAIMLRRQASGDLPKTITLKRIGSMENLSPPDSKIVCNEGAAATTADTKVLTSETDTETD